MSFLFPFIFRFFYFSLLYKQGTKGDMQVGGGGGLEVGP